MTRPQEICFYAEKTTSSSLKTVPVLRFGASRQFRGLMTTCLVLLCFKNCETQQHFRRVKPFITVAFSVL